MKEHFFPLLSDQEYMFSKIRMVADPTNMNLEDICETILCE